MLRVATYNIRKCVGLDWRRRPDRVMEVIGELRADIVALQEADRRFGDRLATLPVAALAERAGMVAVRPPRDGIASGHHGNAILVRHAVEVLRVQALDLPSFEPRGALVADLLLHEAPLRVAAIHLGLRPADQLRQAEALLAALAREAPMPTMVMGDLNAWAPRGATVSLLARVFEPSQPLRSFHTTMPMAALDRIFLGDGLRFRHVALHRSALSLRASDHLPVVAEVERADGDE